jgi:hypothetical protein
MEEIIDELSAKYNQAMHKELAVYITSIEQGTHLVA